MEKQNIKISVIIPVYNGGKWVAQCIENMLCQSYKNLELIVIDDGSTDDTAAIAEKYATQTGTGSGTGHTTRPGAFSETGSGTGSATHPAAQAQGGAFPTVTVTLLRQSNHGLAATRNRGIEAATGDYIHFMDVDDLLGLDYYSLMVEALALTDADMAYGGLINEAMPLSTVLFTDRLLLVAPEDRIAVPSVGLSCSACRYLVRKSLLDDNNLRFEPGLLIEDMPFSLQAAYTARSIVTVPGAVYHYRRRAGSILTRRDRAFVAKRNRHLKQVRAFRSEFLREHGLQSHLIPVKKLKYEILGFVVLSRIVFNNGVEKWYLWGLRVAKKRGSRLN
ncbi:MAG: glycosyltransferase [Alistipes sp.]|jgi:CDP-glycerol glycerophosphotransferase|nr:glycosyltransferase [Alistipes sp.]